MRKLLSALPICALLLGGCAAVQNGEALKAVFDSGVVAYDAGDYPKAYKIWSGIEDQDLAAMGNVAMMLRGGIGVARNPKKAEQLYETAALAGSPIAQANLGDMLLKGEAGPPDARAALPWLVAAAAADHPIAQYELGQMYETGSGGLVPQNLKTARDLYAAAAGHGMKEAQTRLDQMTQPPAAAPPDNNSVRLMQPAPTTVPGVTAAANNPVPLRQSQP